jgi:single-strand DNA-binding protein
MSEVNRVELLGNLGAEPELKQVGANNSWVCKLRVCTTDKYTDRSGNAKEVSDWHNVELWGKEAEKWGTILHKGSPVFVVGSLKTDSYDNKEGQKIYRTAIRATRIFNGIQSAPSARPTAKPGAQKAPPGDDYGAADGDDIPF